MTPIKAAADPSGETLLALAQELRCARAETLGLNGKISMPIELIVHCEAVLSKLAAAPAGNAGVRKALEEIGRYARKIRKSENLIGPAEYMHDAKAMKVWQRALYHEGKTIEGMVKAALRGSELAEPTKDATALSATQPREAFADEIKRADAAPPEASFDNASDMLGYLNAPREAEPVAWLYESWCGENHWSQHYSDAKPAGNKWQRNIRPLYLASPSPIPEAPGGRDPATIEACANIAMLEFERHVKIVEAATNDRALSDSGRSLIQERADNAALAAQRIASQIRALKPQDGGESGR